ncbi:hypothetical protein DFJ73DRAFT_823870 [Zopfochytrium polystomum]|nr:hypothetical protein DFJ73DRAFT_823870 [Zopfochytrium polystomum]
MDFTEVYKQTSFLCTFSPDAKHIATAVDHRVVIRDAETLQILHLFSCLAAVDELAWAADGELILCASFSTRKGGKGAIQVFSLRDPEWGACIEEGLAGLAAVKWAPDARSVLSFSEFQLRITVWSLVDKDAAYIQYPKFSNRGYCFRPDGRYFALAERREGKDTLSIFDCDDWTILKHFPVETNDLEDLAWSPDGRFIAVWDSYLDYKILIYHPDGRRAAVYSAYDHGLGIKTVAWSPSAQFLAVGSFDGKLRLLNHLTWKPIIDLSHPTTLSFPDIAVFRETNIRSVKTGTTLDKNWVRPVEPRPRLGYEVLQPPVTLPSARADMEKPNPRKGISLIEFSADGQHIITKNDSMPNTLWVWDVINLRQVALIQQLTPIKSVEWNPVVPNMFAFTCGGSCIYVWGGPDVGCDAVEVPSANFTVSQFRWCPDGRSLLLMDTDRFCLAFLVDS